MTTNILISINIALQYRYDCFFADAYSRNFIHLLNRILGVEERELTYRWLQRHSFSVKFNLVVQLEEMKKQSRDIMNR